ncbi:MAG TPA: DUF6293 family protein [Nitrososphaerales archaeon]|nr:DUF6293 family protein [Nitrososphaerales archaeon]
MAKNLRVHIVPVGFEVKRVVIPLLRLKADKVYLVSYRPRDGASKYLRKVKGELYKQKQIEVTQQFMNIWNPYECLRKFREIIARETGNGNRVYINVSTGTKITAIAGVLSAMLWGNDVEVYYARADGYRIVEPAYIKEPEEIRVFTVQRPSREQLATLRILKGQPQGKMKKSRLLKALVSAKVIKSKRPLKLGDNSKSFSLQAKYSQLRFILGPMQTNWNFIKSEGTGKSCQIAITEEGKNAFEIFTIP